MVSNPLTAKTIEYKIKNLLAAEPERMVYFMQGKHDRNRCGRIMLDNVLQRRQPKDRTSGRDRRRQQKARSKIPSSKGASSVRGPLRTRHARPPCLLQFRGRRPGRVGPCLTALTADAPVF